MACGEVEVAPDRSSFTTAQYALTACPEGEMLDGIDVSKWQGYVDWSAVAAAGIDFAFIRVSDGLDYQDAYFQSNWSEAKANGIVRGAYQFFRSDEDPVAQAQYLLDEMGPLEPGDLPPVCDVETADGQTPATIADRVQTWLDVVENALGVKPLIYTSPGVWGSYVNSGAFSEYPLWVAHWGATCPTMPTGWSDWVVWQTSDSGSVPGVNGNVDTNLFNGGMQALLDLGYSGGEPRQGEDTYEESATACPLSLAGQTLIQEDGPCAKRLGLVDDAAYHDVQGNAGHAWWTAADEEAPAYQEGVAWLFDVQESGSYSLWAHVPDGVADLTTGAVFEVWQGESVTTVVVDPSAHSGGAVLLGTFEFLIEDGVHEVRALDSFTTPSDEGAAVCFDALEIGPAVYCACDEDGRSESLTCGVDGEMTRVCDGCQWSSWSACDDPPVEADTAGTAGDAARTPTDTTEPELGPPDEADVSPQTTVAVHSVGTSTQVLTTSGAPAAEAGCQGSRPRGEGHPLVWLMSLCFVVFGARGYRLTRLIKRATP